MKHKKLLLYTLLVGSGTTAFAEALHSFSAYSTPSGIHASTLQPRSDSNYIYNLQGVRVSAPLKGIYIQNGKKFIVK